MMQCCESCGQAQELRLYEIQAGNQIERRWWCLECLFWVRGLGLSAEPAPTWVERAALHELPMKPLESAHGGAG
jgi:hypothetical protein